MSNSFYNHGAFPSTGSAATSASMRAELDLISAGFDKMPTLSGNANKFVIVNSTGTGLTQTDVLPAFTVTDTDFTVQDDGDNTRKFQFNAGSITTGNTRIYSMPDLNTTLVGTDVTQTLTNKTLTSPVIATIVNTGTLTLPTSTDTLIGRNTTDTLTNKTLTNPVIGTIINTGTLTLPTSTDTLVGRATSDTLTNKTISGANNTLSNIGNSSLTNSSIVIGSSTLSLGGTLTTLAGVTISGASNTLSNIANASLTNSSVTINSTSVALGASATITAVNPNALTIGTGLSGTSYSGSAAVTIAIDSTVATLSGSQTLSNKTISGSSNTLSNIGNSSLTNSSITIGSSAISLGSTASTITGLTSLSSTGLVMTANAASSTAISAIAQSAGTVTVTAAGHALTSGDLVSIDGVADYTYTGLVTVNVTNANVFTYSRTTTNASSSGGYVTKLQGTWASYSGGTGPSYKGGPMVIEANSQMPGLRVTQSGNGYAFIVEDAANPDTSAFIISNAGDLTINTNKFTVAAATGNTVIGGTTSLAGNVTFATDATYDIGATGANRPRDLFLSRNLVVGGTLTLAGGVNLNGNVTIGDASSDTLTITSTITSNLIFTDNTYDIGASGATRPRNLYLAGLLTMGGALTVNGNTILGDATADTITLNALVSSNMLFTDNSYDIGASGANRPKSIYITSTMYAGSSVWAGTTTFANNGRNSQRVLSVNATADYGGMAMTSYCGTTATIAPILDFNRSRGTTDQSFTAVVSADRLGFLNFRGASGTQFVDAAQIFSYVDGTVTTTSVPGAISLATSSTTAGLVGRYNINSSGIHLWQNVGSDTGGTALQLNTTGLIVYNGLQVNSNTTLNGGTIYLGNATTNDFLVTTTDGSDTSAIRLCAGGTIDSLRGAKLQAFGNENPTYPGQVYLDQGNVSGAATYFRYGSNAIGASMNGAGYWTFNQAIGAGVVGNPSLARIISQGVPGSAAFRAQNGTASRYRSDWAVDSSGTTTFNSYDDTAGQYKPFEFAGTQWAFSNGGGTTYAYFEPNGLRVSSTNAFSSLQSDNLYFGQTAAMGTNSVKNLMRLTDGSNADVNLRIRSGASVSVTTGTAEVQTAAYNMWLSTSGTTGALRVTDTVNNGSGGQVTKPYQACFSAVLSSTGGQATYTVTDALVWSVKPVDNGGNFNTSNGRFTAPVNGSYFFTTNIRWDNTNSANLYFSVTLSINGNNITRALGDLIYAPASNYNYSTVSVIVNLSAGDYVTAGLRQNSGTSFNTTPTECSFNGFLIC